MIEFIKHNIYIIHPLWIILIAIFALPFVWGGIGRLWRHKSKHSVRKQWKFLNIVLLFISFIVIFFLTLINRDTTVNTVFLNPFVIFEQAKANIEVIRTFVMNILLFVPFGMSAVFAFPRIKKTHPIVSTIIIGTFFSLVVELLQLYYSVGVVETNDVIANVLGTAIGCIAYPVFYHHKHRKHHHSSHGGEHHHHHSEHHHHHSDNFT